MFYTPQTDYKQRFMVSTNQLTTRQYARLTKPQRRVIPGYDMVGRDVLLFWSIGIGINLGICGLGSLFPSDPATRHPLAGWILLGISSAALAVAVITALALPVRNTYVRISNRRRNTIKLPGIVVDDDLRFTYLRNADRQKVMSAVTRLLRYNADTELSEQAYINQLADDLSTYLQHTQQLADRLQQAQLVAADSCPQALLGEIERGQRKLRQAACACLTTLQGTLDNLRLQRHDQQSLQQASQDEITTFMLRSAIDSTA